MLSSPKTSRWKGEGVLEREPSVAASIADGREDDDTSGLKQLVSGRSCSGPLHGVGHVEEEQLVDGGREGGRESGSAQEYEEI